MLALRRAALAALAFAAPFAAPLAAQQDSPALVAKARAIHDKVIAIDTHVDFSPAAMSAATPLYVTGAASQVDLNKMEKGGLNTVFFSIYTGQRPDFTAAGYAQAMASVMEKFEAVHRLTEQLAPDRIALARTADDVRRIRGEKKLVALMGVEGGYAIGEDVTNVKKFYDLGARYLSLAHNGHSQLSDSNTGEADGVWKWNGLSPLGRLVVAEANRLGIMMDISHPSKESNLQVMAMTQAPVIASHSGVRALCDHSRNLDDEQLLALKKNGGVVQIVAFSSYLKKAVPDSPERTAALEALRVEFNLPARGGGGAPGGSARGGRGGLAALDSATRERYQARLAEVNAKYPAAPRASVKDLADHIDYAVKLIGIDHVGISSDFDGGGGIDGYSDASEAFNVTLELVRRGYTGEQITKLWGGNTLRVMKDVEQAAKRIQAKTRS